VEFLISADGLDNGQMLVDFGLLKPWIGGIVDAFDHTHVMWEKDYLDYVQAMKLHSHRWIVTPLSPSAEGLAVMFFAMAKQILSQTDWVNGEKCPRIHSVRVHETDTGYAEAFIDDLESAILDFGFKLPQIEFSRGVLNDLHCDMLNVLAGKATVYNPIPRERP
jgi:6-pyruvoyltetrahydropterin/6-carboxytetrahydropterin synthase